MKLCWVDLRDRGALTGALREEALHQRIDAIVVADPADLAALPPTVTKVLMPAGAVPEDVGAITVVDDPTDAAVVFGVLEHGPDGVLMAPVAVGDVTRLKAAAAPPVPDLLLVELTVTGISHVGVGERACVDTCAYLRQDE